MAIKNKHIYWSTEDEFREYYDAGELGLIRGIKTFDENKGYKISTYLYTCIVNEIHKKMYLNNLPKRKNPYGKTVSLNKVVDENEESNELMDFIPDPNANVEQETETKIINEHLMIAINNIRDLKDKKILKMYYGFDGYREHTLQEIADIYKCSKEAVNRRKLRAQNKVKKYMWRRWRYFK